MEKKKIFAWIALLCFVAFSAFLVYEASMPGEVSSEHSGTVSNAIQDATEKVETAVGGGGEGSLSDKITTNFSEFAYMVRKGIGHFGAFALLAMLGTFAFFVLAPDKASGVTVALLLGVIVATLTEYIQLHVEGRYGSFDDVMLDSAGYFAGFIFTVLIGIVVYLVKKSKNKKDVQL